jgi:Domain of unknown function (DUF5134)
MGSPAWLTGSFAVLMLTVAAYCAGRLIVARRWDRPTELDTDAGHVLMGLAMAGMLVARLRVLPPAAWEALFALAAAWYAWRLFRSRRRATTSPWRCLHPAPHLVECTAMLYMLPLAGHGAAAAVGAMTASAAGSSFSALALVMALFMFGYVVRVADRLKSPALALPPIGQRPPADPRPTTSPAAGAPLADRPGRSCLAPRCAALCKIAMGLTMGYMLVVML